MAISAAVRARLFGQPGQVDRVTYQTPWGPKVSIHPQILARFRAACEKAHATVPGWRPLRIDSFNPRQIRGSSEWSLHASALAFDMFATGPGVPPPGGVWTPDDEMPPEFVACFTDLGFRWGGTFKRRDTPHIEWADGLPAPLVDTPAPAAAPQEDGFLMALTDAEQQEILAAVRNSTWPAGTAKEGQHRLWTLVRWTLDEVKALRAEVAALAKKLG